MVLEQFSVFSGGSGGTMGGSGEIIGGSRWF